jgi:hypothetical protein
VRHVSQLHFYQLFSFNKS